MHTNRFKNPLPTDTVVPAIPSNWDGFLNSFRNESSEEFLQVLHRHGFESIEILVPLTKRYTKGRKWSQDELEKVIGAWHNGISITKISTWLNRNPQDILYRLMDYCNDKGIRFSASSNSEGSKNWNRKVESCALDLFKTGLPAWKIASLFKVDFEYVEKKMYLNRNDYGHSKKNPFAINTDHKISTNQRIIHKYRHHIASALDAFSGFGNTIDILLRMNPETRIVAIESDSEVFASLARFESFGSVRLFNDDNRCILPQLADDKLKFDLIDLDPFVTCHEQIPHIWSILSDRSLLFLTFGGEYRRSFIQTNRKAIRERYGFYDNELPNSEYLEEVPYYFLGYVAKSAAERGFTFDIVKSVRYANNCRFWLEIKAQYPQQCQHWRNNHVEYKNGYRYCGLKIPRFKQIRHELDQKQQTELFL